MRLTVFLILLTGQCLLSGCSNKPIHPIYFYPQTTEIRPTSIQINFQRSTRQPARQTDALNTPQPQDLIIPQTAYSTPAAIIIPSPAPDLKCPAFDVQPFHLPPDSLNEQDLNADGISEVILYSQKLEIFACQQGKYQVIFEQEPHDPAFVLSKPVINDYNGDKLDEIILFIKNNNLEHNCLAFSIWQWDGSVFRNLIPPGQSSAGWDPDTPAQLASYFKVNDVTGDFHILPVGNDALDLIIANHQPENTFSPGLYRNRHYSFTWNGQSFTPQPVSYDPPVYRFQAVQDGDRALLSGDLTRANRLYREAIQNFALDWWSKARYEYAFTLAQENPKSENILPLPDPDPDEYATLSGYAHYRLLLISTQQGALTDAQAEYAALANFFPRGEPGYAYTELARAFWETYQMTGSIDEGCRRAISYVEQHQEEIIGPFDPSWHGLQSFHYIPADFCLSIR